MDIGVVGYNSQVFSDYITLVFGTKKPPLIEKLKVLFSNYEKAGISPGNIKNFDSELAMHSASTLPSSTGSIVIPLVECTDKSCNYFCGIRKFYPYLYFKLTN